MHDRVGGALDAAAHQIGQKTPLRLEDRLGRTDVCEIHRGERTLSAGREFVPIHDPRSQMKLVAIAATAALLAVPAALGGTPTLTGTVGPGFTITLTQGGKKVSKLKAGKYVIKIADKSNIHNFHLTGPGVNKKTGVGSRAHRRGP